MAEFAVNTTLLRSYADQISQLQTQLDSVAIRLGAMQLGSVLKVNASTALIARVGDCKWAAAHQSDDLGRLAKGLTEVAGLYENTEKTLSDPQTTEQAARSAAQAVASAVGDTASTFSGESVVRTVMGWAKKCVPIGLASAIWNFTDGSTKSTISGIKGVVDAFGNGTKAIFATPENSTVWTELLGLGKNTGHGWKNAWDKMVSGHSLSAQTTTAGKVGVIAKWAGYALTVAGNAVENYQEYQDGEISAGRAVGETIVESVVDIGLSVGAGLLAAAVLPASAPVVLVGAASAAVVWAANGICKAITGKDAGELVADAVCDAVETTVNCVKSAGNAIKEGAKAAWSGFCSLFG